MGGFRTSMAWLHTWAGLVFCWILYFVFVTGTLGYFDAEIDRWMQPEQAPAEPMPVDASVGAAQRYLEREARGADRWSITPAHGRDRPQLAVHFRMPKPESDDEEARRGDAELDVATGEELPPPARETGGGQALYRMHYSLHYLDRQLAFRFVGFIALLMLLALVTGIVVHKNIFKDLFTFRPGKGSRSWLDAHNLLSVSSLPFQLMITYSGLLFTIGVWMPMIGFVSYGFDRDAVGREFAAATGEVSVERSGEDAPLADLAAIARSAETEWGPEGLSRIDVHIPGDRHARVVASRHAGVAAFGDRLVFDGTTGERLMSYAGSPNAPIAFAVTLIGLHEGLFAGPLLRWLYVLSGLLGCAMVATGAIYWTAKRKRKMGDGRYLGYRLVDSLNVGTIMGLPIGIAAYFWANRLLPLSMDHRPEWEMHCLFAAWLVCLVHPFFRPGKQAWREQAWLASFAFGALPIVNGFTTNAHLGRSLGSGDWVLAGFDLSMLGLALGFAAVALMLARGDRARDSAKAALRTGEQVGAP